MMHHIVSNLWLGSQQDADELVRNNPDKITAILNVRGPDAYHPAGRNQAAEHPGKAYKWIPAPDTGVISSEHVREALVWLQEQTDKHERILIHCNHGISRSPGFLAAFMVKSGISSSLEEAKATIKVHRPVQPAAQMVESVGHVVLISALTGLLNRKASSAPKQDSAEQSETKEASPASVDSDARRTRRRSRVGWALVAACGTALLGILFYFREGRLAAPITVPQVAIEAHEPSSGSIPSAAAAQPEMVQQSMPAERRQPATIIVLKPSFPAAFSSQHESRHRKVILPQPPVATMDSTPRERVQVAEAPERGSSYPVAPNPTLTGKVSLKAVIGIDGTVTEVDVLSGKHALAGAAVRAVRHWRYRPLELKGHAVEAETNIVISFVGADAVSISFPAAH